MEKSRSGNIAHFSHWKVFFIFFSSLKEDCDLIFRSIPYLFGTDGIYLNRWNLDFDLVVDIPSAVLVWVHLPRLPLPCWDDDCLESIGNSPGKYLKNKTLEVK